jgi:predicted DNA-binding protein
MPKTSIAKTSFLSVRLSEVKKKKLEEYSIKNGQHLSYTIEKMIDDFLEKAEAEKK